MSGHVNQNGEGTPNAAPARQLYTVTPFTAFLYCAAAFGSGKRVFWSSFCLAYL